MADTPMPLGASGPRRTIDVRRVTIVDAVRGQAVVCRMSGWLCLAAAPAFAIMALLSAILGAAPALTLCSAAHDAWRPTGMVPMYLLMSVFHSVPWLKLRRR